MRLKELRKQAKLTVPALSSLCGIPVRTIEEIERRKASTVANAIKLADTLHVTLDELCRESPAE